MNYYRRYDRDGACEVICIRCFLTVGTARGLATIREMEALHVCGGRAVHVRQTATLAGGSFAKCPSAFPRNEVERLFGPSGKLKTLNLSVLFLSVVTFLYVVPTVVELLMAQRLNPWLSVILPGDVIGCACLVAVFKMRGAGLALYLLLTAFEGSLYAFHIVTANALMWIVDVVPTLTVVAIILRVRLATAARLVSRTS